METLVQVPSGPDRVSDKDLGPSFQSKSVQTPCLVLVTSYPFLTEGLLSFRPLCFIYKRYDPFRHFERLAVCSKVELFINDLVTSLGILSRRRLMKVS